MGKVLTHMTMSLDGFIADSSDQVAELFDWYQAGDATVPSVNEHITFKVDDASAELVREWTTNFVSYVAVGRVEAPRTAPSLWCPPPITPSIRGGDRS